MGSVHGIKSAVRKWDWVEIPLGDGKSALRRKVIKDYMITRAGLNHISHKIPLIG